MSHAVTFPKLLTPLSSATKTTNHAPARHPTSSHLRLPTWSMPSEISSMFLLKYSEAADSAEPEDAVALRSESSNSTQSKNGQNFRIIN